MGKFLDILKDDPKLREVLGIDEAQMQTMEAGGCDVQTFEASGWNATLHIPTSFYDRLLERA